ncbi:hypothetical protein ACWD04_31395 [Streptomyces sp. NPDC002911]
MGGANPPTALLTVRTPDRGHLSLAQDLLQRLQQRLFQLGQLTAATASRS